MDPTSIEGSTMLERKKVVENDGSTWKREHVGRLVLSKDSNSILQHPRLTSGLALAYDPTI